MALPQIDPKFLKKLNSYKLDLVHIHSPFPMGKIGAAYAKRHNIPLVATLHSQFKQDVDVLFRSNIMRKIAMRYLMSTFDKCDECWAVNDAIKELYINDYKIKSHVDVVYNATNHRPVLHPEKAALKVNERYNLDPSIPVFNFVGRIDLIKNIGFTLEVLKILKLRGLEFKMLFVGDGIHVAHVCNMIKEYNLEDRVIMCGMIRDIKFVERINSRSSLMLFPSLYDANSLVQIEAAAQGTPTVFLEGAKTASTVTNGVNGFIVKNDINAYADAIMDILSRPDYLKQVSEGAFRDLYITWDSVVDNVYNRYCDIMKRWQK